MVSDAVSESEQANTVQANTEQAAQRPGRRARFSASSVFLRIWLGFVVSIVGDQFYRVALILGVSPRGAAALSALGIALALPTAFFGLIGGSLIDRTDKFRLLIKTDLLRAVIVTCLGFAFISRSPNFGVLLALSGLLSIVSVLFMPALQALMSQLASKGTSEIISMDTWLLGSANFAAVVGPSIGGALFVATSPSLVMWIDAGTFLWSAVMLLWARRVLSSAARAEQEHKKEGGGRFGAKHSIEGLRFIFKDDILRSCFTTFPVMEFGIYSIPFLLPLIIPSGPVYGVCLGAIGVGRLAGMIVLRRTSLKAQRGLVLRSTFLIQGAAVIVAGLVGTGLVIAALLFVMGICSGLAQVSMATYVQVEIPANMRGRAFASLAAMVSWLQPLGALVFGAIAAATSGALALCLVGAVLFGGGVRLMLTRSLGGLR
jgi:MFS family permease